jgi:hypothetical protein
VPSEILPPEPDMERLDLIFAISKFSVVAGKTIVIETILQTDFNLGSGGFAKVAKGVVHATLPKILENWNLKMNNYLFKKSN